MKRMITILLILALLLPLVGCAAESASAQMPETTPATEDISPDVAPAPVSDFPFTDVEPWKRRSISLVYEKGIMRGTSETTFSPDQDFSRAMLAAVLFRLYHERDANASDPTAHPFTDVPAWASPYVAWAFEVGLTRGVAATRFAPSTVTTRQDFSVMLHRFAGMLGISTASPPDQTGIFEDAHLLEPWAEDAMDWAVHHGLIHRNEGDFWDRFYLLDTVPRFRAAVLLLTFVELIMHPPESASLSYPELEARIKHDWAEVLNDYLDWLRTTSEYPHPPLPPHLHFPIWFHSQPFHRHHADHVRIDGYFGTYNGSIVLMIRSRFQTFDESGWGVEVAGYRFGFHVFYSVVVWNDGVFYNLTNKCPFGGTPLSIPGAYELGLLTVEDIGRAHAKFVEWRPTFEW